jgi:hypothetical protein
MHLPEEIKEDIRNAMLQAFEEHLYDEINYTVEQAVKKYGRFDNEQTPALLDFIERTPGVSMDNLAEAVKDWRMRAYNAETELREYKEGLETKRVWLPLVQKLRDIFVSQNNNDAVAMIDNYICSGQL